VRSKRTRNAQVRQESPEEQEDDLPCRKTARKVSGGSSSAGGRGKKVGRLKETQGNRKPRGTAGHRRRSKKDDAEHIEGVDDSSEDEDGIRNKKGDRGQFKTDRAKRIAEFKALDDYELEVEEVLF